MSSAQSTQRTTCWSCGESFFKADRHCPKCGADSWNRPQGPAARSVSPRSGTGFRPIATTSAETSLIGGGTTYVTATADDRQTTIAAGVGILATFAAMSFWFWFAIGAIGAINDPGFAGSYLSTPRVLIAFLVAVAGTVVTWAIARAVVDA